MKFVISLVGTEEERAQAIRECTVTIRRLLEALNDIGADKIEIFLDGEFTNEGASA